MAVDIMTFLQLSCSIWLTLPVISVGVDVGALCCRMLPLFISPGTFLKIPSCPCDDDDGCVQQDAEPL